MPAGLRRRSRLRPISEPTSVAAPSRKNKSSVDWAGTSSIMVLRFSSGFVRRHAVRRLPELGLHDRKAAAGGEVVDQPGDILRRWVGLHHEHRLSALAEHRQYGIVLVQQHPMI